MVNFLAAAVIVWGYGVLTYLIFFVITDRNLLISTILNAVAIIFIVVWEKIENRYDKSKPKNKEINPSTSIKTGLYLYYVVVTTGTALLSAEPNIAFLSNFYDYFLSVYYGLLILFAIDKFVEQLFKDMSK